MPHPDPCRPTDRSIKARERGGALPDAGQGASGAPPLVPVALRGTESRAPKGNGGCKRWESPIALPLLLLFRASRYGSPGIFGKCGPRRPRRWSGGGRSGWVPGHGVWVEQQAATGRGGGGGGGYPATAFWVEQQAATGRREEGGGRRRWMGASHIWSGTASSHEEEEGEGGGGSASRWRLEWNNKQPRRGKLQETGWNSQQPQGPQIRATAKVEAGTTPERGRRRK